MTRCLRFLAALFSLVGTVIRPPPATLGQTRRQAQIRLNADGTFTFTDTRGQEWVGRPRFEDDLLEPWERALDDLV